MLLYKFLISLFFYFIFTTFLSNIAMYFIR